MVRLGRRDAPVESARKVASFPIDCWKHNPSRGLWGDTKQQPRPPGGCRTFGNRYAFACIGTPRSETRQEASHDDVKLRISQSGSSRGVHQRGNTVPDRRVYFLRGVRMVPAPPRSERSDTPSCRSGRSRGKSCDDIASEEG